MGKHFYWIIGLMAVGFFACEDQIIKPSVCNNLEAYNYAPSSYTVIPPEGFPAMEHPDDNPITVEGIELGRHLFYDPILSRDSTISCSSCHQLNKAFTDGLSKAEGIEGRLGRHSSMSLINIGYSWIKNRPHNFMWDGKFTSLEEQIVGGPIEDPVEMDNDWETVENVLRQHPSYPQMFRSAFGINCSDEINRQLIAKAIAQFERTPPLTAA